jgi:pyruvate/2-oxoglutarate dehydrogenase complex dihydrolipoamide acyltransferase (E2) component
MEIKLQEASWEGTQDDTQALLDKWLVGEKEPVIKGQALATVVLVKASIDIEAPSDGFVEKILIAAGESFATGTVLAHFTDKVLASKPRL